MRAILFDWMMEVSEEFMLKRECYYIATNYVERYLQEAEYLVPKSELQLIGVTSLMLASKVDEVFVPRSNDFALATDGGYTKE
jgi:cyclin E